MFSLPFVGRAREGEVGKLPYSPPPNLPHQGGGIIYVKLTLNRNN